MIPVIARNMMRLQDESLEYRYPNVVREYVCGKSARYIRRPSCLPVPMSDLRTDTKLAHGGVQNTTSRLTQARTHERLCTV